VNATVATMADGTTPNRLSFTRCTLSGTLTSSAAETYLANNALKWVRVAGSGKMWMIGNLVNTELSSGLDLVVARDASTLNAYNNIFRREHPSGQTGNNVGIVINASAKGDVRNNFIFNMASSFSGNGEGIRLDGSGGSFVDSNIFLAVGRYYVRGPLTLNVATYNNSTAAYDGGIVPQNTLVSDPLVVDATNFVLQAGSPARDAGNPDPRFNDIDGTRNDIGIYGGPFYDPDGRSGSKPVVLKAELDNTQFVKGDLSSVKLKAAGAATGTP
jgi:hypothetical protein